MPPATLTTARRRGSSLRCAPARLALLACLLAAPSLSAQIFVDDDAPADPGPHDPTLGDPLEDGSAAHPFDSIGEAIAALPGPGAPAGAIHLAPGRYAGPGNGGLVTGKAFFLRGLRGADETIVDLQHSTNFLTITGSASIVSLEGLTIAHGTGAGAGAIEMLSAQTELWLAACVLADNHATGDGVAGGALLVRGTLDCVNTAFVGNTSAGRGGALAIANDSTNGAAHDLVLCTFRDNLAAVDGGAIWAEGTATVPLFVRNAEGCIFWGNQSSAGGQHQIGEAHPGNFRVSTSVVQGGWSGLGSDNQDADPLFAFPDGFHLSTRTPAPELEVGLVCSQSPIDADGQPRDCAATEPGADAVLPVTLALPASRDSRLLLAVAGAVPGRAVAMLVGLGLQEPPVATPRGLLQLPADELRVLALPPVDADGTSAREIDVSALPFGTDLVLQALVGGELLAATTYPVH